MIREFADELAASAASHVYVKFLGHDQQGLPKEAALAADLVTTLKFVFLAALVATQKENARTLL